MLRPRAPRLCGNGLFVEQFREQEPESHREIAFAVSRVAQVTRFVDAAMRQPDGSLRRRHDRYWPIVMAWRARELVDLRWDQIDFGRGNPGSAQGQEWLASTHPIRGDQLRALPRLARDQESKRPSCAQATPSAVNLGAGLLGWLSAPGRRWALKRTRLCFAVLADLPWPKSHRYPGSASTSRPSEHPAHGALSGADARPAQRLLALVGCGRRLGLGARSRPWTSASSRPGRRPLALD